MLAHKMRSEGQTLEVISEKTICLRFIRKVPIVEGRYLHSSEQTTSPINIRRATGCFSEISVYTNAYVSTVPMRFLGLYTNVTILSIPGASVPKLNAAAVHPHEVVIFVIRTFLPLTLRNGNV